MDARQGMERLQQGKRGVYLSIAAYLVLTAAKIGVGLAAGSQALVADGWNNASDVAASLAILIGLTVAIKPADGNHRYGHFRAETAAALIAALFMATVGLDVLRVAIRVLFTGEQLASPEPLAMMTATVSAAVMYGVYRINRRIGERTQNAAVLAAAYDNRSDALVSLGTLAGIVIAQLGWRWADPLVALAVALLILGTAWKVGYEAIHSLTDGFEAEKLKRIEQQIRQVDGIREIIDVRARYHGSVVHVDVTIGVDHHLNVVESHALTERIEDRLLGFEAIERVYVHVEPARLSRKVMAPSPPSRG